MTSRTPPDDAHPYLRAASAGVRHHTRAWALSDANPLRPADRVHLDVLHAHLTALHQLLDHLAENTQPPHPTAGRHLATAQTRLWQAASEVHSAFHLLPSTTAAQAEASACHPERLPEGPPVLTICQRHLAAGHSIRRKTTPTDLRPRTTACVR
ncbi:DUF6238 family protein [Streptomyces scabiei]|uniref:DUF6238 family protein n=2 Tax=Streptomyces TaxID=1883 RepID=A0ABW9IMZ7_STRGJ|nr:MULTISPECIES: DUF6238 family protein [Streptomyces]MBP5860564.1 hypothetical protein [Streptomyces sp. LBUM 1484]MBP5878947.1 hypothetical protein [Streptomyces sp. LBUM 1477]MBP5886876.1 hypothetical protein [Streptomyces sp. LBUM 1487]MBP5902873.1 hypothetical protein [Streptomyces sp. LBUM 1488]MDX2631315.1 DUF6238 family protein [Streptomyces scabiei]